MNTFTADHHGFYLNGALFFPLIQDEGQGDWSNTVLVRLPARLSDDLDWSEEIQIAEQVVLSGKYILWEVDLGLTSFQFAPEDSASFYSFSLALEEFAKKLWPRFQNHTFGVALYRGGLQLHQNFPMFLWETAFLEEPDHELCRVQLLSEYLHRLISFLPESVLPFALIDVTEVSSAARQAQLFSNERFEYLHLALKGAKSPFPGIRWEEGCSTGGWLGSAPGASENLTAPSLGVCLPGDVYIDAALRQEMDALVAKLKDKRAPFRIVSEEKLTEQWDGLDKLFVFSSALSPQGKRKLLGFTAAGGEVCLNFSEELLESTQVFE